MLCPGSVRARQQCNTLADLAAECGPAMQHLLRKPHLPHRAQGAVLKKHERAATTVSHCILMSGLAPSGGGGRNRQPMRYVRYTPITYEPPMCAPLLYRQASTLQRLLGCTSEILGQRIGVWARAATTFAWSYFGLGGAVAQAGLRWPSSGLSAFSSAAATHRIRPRTA